MRKRRVKHVLPVQDKAWHDAQLAKGFWDRNSKRYRPWIILKADCAAQYSGDFDELPTSVKKQMWYLLDEQTMPILPKGRRRY